MSGKRLLDVVAIIKAARVAAQKHVEYRSMQYDLYSQTSSLLKAIRNQTNRVTETIKAASILASRVDDTSSYNPSDTGYINSYHRSQSDNYFHDYSSLNSSPNESLNSSLESLPSKSDDYLLIKKTMGETDVHGLFDKIETNIQKKPATISSQEISPKPNYLHDNSSCDKKNESQSCLQVISKKKMVLDERRDNKLHTAKVIQSLDMAIQGNRPTDTVVTKMKSTVNNKQHSDHIGEQDDYHITRHTEHYTQTSNNLGPYPYRNISGNETVSDKSSFKLRESKVPASRVARLWNYGSLAIGMFGGVVREGLRRASGGASESGSYILNESNMNRLVNKLSRMRGAALKIGQMISFQDSSTLPAPVLEVLLRVQDQADYMPTFQRDKVLKENLGPNWRDHFASFDEIPLAAASIGQVHRAVLKSNGAEVAVKVQYPGVAKSIDSDLKNISIFLTASKLLPKGLFLDKTIANARTELAWECDYIREAKCAHRFRQLLHSEHDIFSVPKIYSEISGPQVLTMQFMKGVAITKIKDLTQAQKDWIGTQILRLCLREIVEFRFMQTDPNWTNFLYNKDTCRLELLDFGASREYSQDFIFKYAQLLVAASRFDRESLRKISIDLGYLTGYESEAMLDAHISSVLTLAEPFCESSPSLYDFSGQNITDRVRGLIPIMIKERLAPPPEETYSLHRKLSGAFLLCARLGTKVPCRKLFEESLGHVTLR